MPNCRRCGLCCYLIDKKTGKQTTKPCKYLVKHGKIHSCRVYGSRLGKVIGEINGEKNYCVDREASNLSYIGCPYNRDDDRSEDEGQPTMQPERR
jgi:hypothetical protein